MAVPGLALGDDLAALHVEGGKQRGRAVAHVVMRDPFEVAQAHRQDRLGALQGLNLALLIDAEDQRFVWRVEVEPHDITHFIHEERIVRELEGFAPVRLQSKQPEEPMDRALGNAGLCREVPDRPMSRVLGPRLQHLVEETGHTLIVMRARAA